MALLVVLVACLFGAECLGAQARPNILHIHADDYRADALGAFGHPVVRTPNLDKLVETGMRFTRCYTMGAMVGAVCLPSRTMMLTGRSWLRCPAKRGEGDPETALPSVLKKAGYQTWHCGKSGNEYTVGLRAFETNLSMDDHSPGLRRGSSERHADAAIRYLREHPVEHPFYMYIAPPVPHDPRVAAPEFHGLYDPEKMPLPPAFLPQHPFNNGEMTVRDEKLAPWPRTAEDTRRQLAEYYACISGLDHHVGRIFEELRRSGEWHKTIVVFTGDNGLSMGDHGLFGKQNLYEFGGMHVPCVIAGPGIPHGTSDALVYLMDLYPTFAEWAGATLPEGVEGRSLAPVLQGKSKGVREVLYTGYRDCQRSLRDARWKLIRYPQVDRTQLFDLDADPHELVDLSNQPKHAALLRDLFAKLDAEMRRYGDAQPLQVSDPKPAAWSPPTEGETAQAPRKDRK